MYTCRCRAPGLLLSGDETMIPLKAADPVMIVINKEQKEDPHGAK